MNRDSQFVPLQSLTAPGEEQEFAVELSEASRRRFLSLMAGSLALAGLSGCTRQPTETIMPYVKAPEDVIPGKPKYYASANPGPGSAQGVIVESHLGRPTKVEGNPDHPASLGASSVHSQASLMDLYDPDRAQEINYLGINRSWEDFLQALQQALAGPRANKGAGFRILTETVLSPSLGAQIEAVLQMLPQAKWYQFEPAGQHSARAAASMVFGKPVHTYYNFLDADVVVSLDSDFLASGFAATRYAGDFAKRRRRGDRLDMNRLYVVESTMTATGGKADHRLALSYTEIDELARSLLDGVRSGDGGSLHANWVKAAADDLKAHRGACIVIPGEHQSHAVHALAHVLNTELGNVGKTVIHTDPIEFQSVDQIGSLRELVGEMNAGQVECLLILGGNPVFGSPSDLQFEKALQKTKISIHVSSHFNETSLKTTWHIPEPHWLEDWGDTRAFDGTVSIIQPLIAPMYSSHSYLTVLDAILQFPGRASYEIVRAYWQGHAKAPDFEAWWRKSVHDGLIASSALPAIDPGQPKSFTAGAAQKAPGLQVVFRPDVYLYDGRFANNIWLQELPRPMTKLTWDNAVFLSERTAKRLNVKNQDHVSVRRGDAEVWGSVWILPGQPDDTVTLDLGYGRTHSGRAGDGAGFNAYLLRTSEALWTAGDIEIRGIGGHYPLATTQMEQSMEDRDVVIHNTIEGYRQHPDFARQKEHEPPANLTLYPHWNYQGYAWSMSIDLTACVNCQACVVACQAENNIPVVGKEQVLARRAMHWLRIDVYYEKNREYPATHYAPIPCMQCEDAPCELVCPVQATNHSADGLNDMVYNRCVGTRYCSNNCPWKVRRFNFLLYQDWTTETLKLQRNPDVTVRSRGVMEKCTYCVQRIRETEIKAQTEDRPIRDGEILTACQQACPTQAIVFGDKNNPANRVSQLKAGNLNYAMYSELNTRPRTTYLAELRNPNPALNEGSAT